MKKFLFLSLSVLVFGVLASGREVSGSVKCGKQKLSGVIVTDGTSFTKTGKNGKFTLDIQNDADFVYIVTPSGYAAPFDSGVPQFYMEAKGQDKFNFQLIKLSDSKDYNIIAIADPQTRNERHFAQFSASGLPELYRVSDSLSSINPTVGIALGDISWDNTTETFPLYKEAMSKINIPFYAVVGNHDHRFDIEGDKESSLTYREFFGPENYAFALGDDYVIVLDNIIYNTQYKYVTGYAEHVLDWVEKFLEFIPESSHIFIAQHAPFIFWFRNFQYATNGEILLSMLEGREVTFLSGHTHINNNLDIAPGIRECNIASICGTWWMTQHCNDGTPAGYKIIEKRDNRLSWYFKTIGRDKDFQMEVYGPGEVEQYPNAVMVNIWDYDSTWTVEWFQDGEFMGQMQQVESFSPVFIRQLNAVYADKGKEAPGYQKPRKNIHYFLANPDLYAEKISIKVRSGDGREWNYELELKDYVDVQAHRGGDALDAGKLQSN